MDRSVRPTPVSKREIMSASASLWRCVASPNPTRSSISLALCLLLCVKLQWSLSRFPLPLSLDSELLSLFTRLPFLTRSHPLFDFSPSTTLPPSSYSWPSRLHRGSAVYDLVAYPRHTYFSLSDPNRSHPWQIQARLWRLRGSPCLFTVRID